MRAAGWCGRSSRRPVLSVQGSVLTTPMPWTRAREYLAASVAAHPTRWVSQLKGTVRKAPVPYRMLLNCARPACHPTPRTKAQCPKTLILRHSMLPFAVAALSVAASPRAPTAPTSDAVTCCARRHGEPHRRPADQLPPTNRPVKWFTRGWLAECPYCPRSVLCYRPCLPCPRMVSSVRPPAPYP